MASPNEQLDVNYRYFADFVASLPNAKKLRVLDYGCGDGQIVRLIRGQGIECYGVEVFYEGASFDELRESEFFRTGVIREFPPNGPIPFPDQFFDVIISNQVLEHVENKALALNNLNRVLKDDGFMYHHFPSRETIREGHIGIPLSHWWMKGRTRYVYTLALRAIGFGYHKKGLTLQEWTLRKLEWIDTYCFYEPYRTLRLMLEKNYVLSHHEVRYCRFRAGNRGLLRALLNIRPLTGFYERLFRRLAFMAVKLEKKQL